MNYQIYDGVFIDVNNRIGLICWDHVLHMAKQYGQHNLFQLVIICNQTSYVC